jgi:hypothetical protein
MTEKVDPMESELRAFRPREVSPGLKRRIAEQLVVAPRVNRRAKVRLSWSAVLAGGWAAACLAAALVGRNWSGDVHRTNLPVVAAVQDAQHVPPTLLAYSRAAHRSPEALDSLLDKHAALGSQPNFAETPIRAFARFDVELNSFMGER